jgi:hypothetical protein
MLGGDPAYAVTKQHNGTVTITLHELADPAAATRDLRAAGLPARVLRGQRPGACGASAITNGPVRLPTPMSHLPGGYWAFFTLPMADGLGNVVGWWVNGSTNDLTFAPSAVPRGVEVLLVEYTNADGGKMMGVALVRSPAPACWSDPTVG